jgi:DnaJ-class molecular chaperone
MPGKNYYEMLELTKNASEADIKKAYRLYLISLR